MRSMMDLLLPASYFPRPASYFLLPTSYFLLPTSYVLLPTSYFLLPTHLLLTTYLEGLNDEPCVSRGEEK